MIALKEDIIQKYFETRTKFETANILQESRQLMNSIQVQHAKWGPNSTNLILIINNDLYFIDSIDTGQVDKFNLERLTYDGKSSTIYNGLSDYVYSSKYLNFRF